MVVVALMAKQDQHVITKLVEQCAMSTCSKTLHLRPRTPFYETGVTRHTPDESVSTARSHGISIANVVARVDTVMPSPQVQPCRDASDSRNGHKAAFKAQNLSSAIQLMPSRPPPHASLKCTHELHTRGRGAQIHHSSALALRRLSNIHA